MPRTSTHPAGPRLKERKTDVSKALQLHRALPHLPCVSQRGQCTGEAAFPGRGTVSVGAWVSSTLHRQLPKETERKGAILNACRYATTVQCLTAKCLPVLIRAHARTHAYMHTRIFLFALRPGHLGIETCRSVMHNDRYRLYGLVSAGPRATWKSSLCEAS